MKKRPFCSIIQTTGSSVLFEVLSPSLSRWDTMIDWNTKRKPFTLYFDKLYISGVSCTWIFLSRAPFSLVTSIVSYRTTPTGYDILVRHMLISLWSTRYITTRFVDKHEILNTLPLSYVRTLHTANLWMYVRVCLLKI